jgi:hypothetical protein
LENAMSKASSIVVSKHEDTLRLLWDNRHVPKSNGLFVILVVFWLFWCPSTLFATAVLCASAYAGAFPLTCFCAFWCIFGWAGTLLIPYRCLERWSLEWIEVSPGSVTDGTCGLFTPATKTYSLGPGDKLLLGYYSDETMVTLSFVSANLGWFQGRELLAYWLSLKTKEDVFLAIKAFVEANKIRLAFERNGV